MKKYFIILGLLISVYTFGQRKTWDVVIADTSMDIVTGTDTIRVLGTDTVVWADVAADYYFGPAMSAELKFHSIDASDGTFGIVVANMDSTYSFVDGRFPVTLNATNYAYSNEYGSTVSSVMWSFSELPYRKLGFYFSKGSLSVYEMRFIIRQL